jgi:hypothetical protein
VTDYPDGYPHCVTCKKVLEDCGCDGYQGSYHPKAPKKTNPRQALFVEKVNVGATIMHLRQALRTFENLREANRPTRESALGIVSEAAQLLMHASAHDLLMRQSGMFAEPVDATEGESAEVEPVVKIRADILRQLIETGERAVDELRMLADEEETFLLHAADELDAALQEVAMKGEIS